MAVRPSSTPEWSDDANYPAGSDAWSGTPTKVEPTGGEKDDGFVPGTMPPAQWFNWLLNLLSNWIAYFAAIIDSNEEHTYQTPKARSIVIPASAWPGSNRSFQSDSGQTILEVDSMFCWLNLSRYLPEGAVITAIHVIVEPGAARAVTGNRMKVLLTHQTAAYDFINPPVAPSPVIVDQENDDGTADLQTISLTGLSHPIVSGTSGASGRLTQLVIQAGNTAAADFDTLWAANVQFNDPGPRSV